MNPEQPIPNIRDQECPICWEVCKLLVTPWCCKHVFCHRCTGTYFLKKETERVRPVLCPVQGCSRKVNPECFRKVFPVDKFPVWRAYALEHPRFYSVNDCQICFDGLKEPFRPYGCSHVFCVQCTTDYIRFKLHEKVERVICPIEGCNLDLSPESFSHIIPSDELEKWRSWLCGGKKFYCSLTDGSSLLSGDLGVATFSKISHGFLNSDEDASKDTTISDLHSTDFFANSSAKEAIFTDSFSGRHSILDGNDDTSLVTKMSCINCGEIKNPSVLLNCGRFCCSECVLDLCNLGERTSAITCPYPPCYGWLELDSCRSILTEATIVRWSDLLLEGLIPVSQRFYCPYEDCPFWFINDGKEEVVESYCPSCGRMFCAQCKSAWHFDMSCEVKDAITR